MQDRDSNTVRAWAVLRLLLALGAGLLPTLVWAEDPAAVPDHAYIDFGDHWKCDRGFKRVANRCEEFQVPAHAFLNYSGDSWRCERGYKRADGECRSLEVPEHAYVNFTGKDWVCDRGFKREGNRCSPE